MDLDFDVLVAYQHALAEQRRADAWTTQHEMLATIVELLHTLVNDVRTGMPVLLVRKRGRDVQPMHWPRPPWIEARRASRPHSGRDSGEIVIHNPRQLVSMLKGKN